MGNILTYLELPQSLEIDGEYYEIDSDFRNALRIMQLYNDRACSLSEKHVKALEMLYNYIDSDGNYVERIPQDREKALKKAFWFLNIGQDSDDKPNTNNKRLLDYNKDAILLFSAVNQSKKGGLTLDIREEDYVHWWTFYSMCQNIDPDSRLSYYMQLREKMANGTLTKEEYKYVDEHREEIILENYKNTAELSLEDELWNL